jgi:hypothetical protein
MARQQTPFIVTGPGVEGHPAETVNHGLSAATTFACRAKETCTYYVLETTGVLTHIPRAGQFTTEFSRADILKRIAEGKTIFSEVKGWKEPRRFGGCLLSDTGEHSRYTSLRIQTEGQHEQHADFWVIEEYVGNAMFERVLDLEAGSRVKLRGYVKHSNSHFTPTTTRVLIVKAVTGRDYEPGRVYSAPVEQSRMQPGYEFTDEGPRPRTDDEARALRGES